MPTIKRVVWISGGVLLVIGLAIGLAVFLPGREAVYDFIMLYAASLGVIHRVPIYDNAALAALTAAKISASGGFTLFPYPYPPWVALSTFYLGFLPLDQAASAWMLLNIAMLVTSVVLLTTDRKPFFRMLITLAALMFIPALGLIVVGQYSAPVLLGACLFMLAARREDAPLTALGLLLMTFKPHLGLFLLPVGFLWLVFQRTPFARRAVWLTVAGALVLGLLGFIADPAWPAAYIRSLTSYTNLPGVANRDLSASFPVLLVKMVLGQPNPLWTAWLSMAIVGIISILFWRFRVFKNVETLMTGCVLLTLLGNPYLFNYDYVLLLLPLIYLAGQARSLAARCVLATTYFLPWLSLVLERSANVFYAISAIVLIAILLRKTNESVY